MDYFNGTAILDIAGVVQERYAYSAFGVRRIMAADFSVRSSSIYAWDFGFQGQFGDVETAWCNYGYRFYLPALGRWINRDPIGEGGGMNVYVFSANRTLNTTDWLGLSDITVGKCEVKLVWGHGEKGSPIKFDFPDGNSCSGGGFVGCWPGEANNLIPESNQILGLPLHGGMMTGIADGKLSRYSESLISRMQKEQDIQEFADDSIPGTYENNYNEGVGNAKTSAVSKAKEICKTDCDCESVLVTGEGRGALLDKHKPKNFSLEVPCKQK